MKIEGEKVVVFICADEERKEAMIELLSGKSITAGECTLNHINIRKNIKDYKKKVDYINPKGISSELTVRNYLIFYGMVSGVYYEGMIDEFSELLAELEMEEVLDKKVSELSRQEQILVRCIAARLKKVELLLGNHILENKTADEQKQLLNFLDQYFIKKSCMCILFENQKEDVDKVIDEVMLIEDSIRSGNRM